VQFRAQDLLGAWPPVRGSGDRFPDIRISQQLERNDMHRSIGGLVTLLVTTVLLAGCGDRADRTAQTGDGGTVAAPPGGADAAQQQPSPQQTP